MSYARDISCTKQTWEEACLSIEGSHKLRFIFGSWKTQWIAQQSKQKHRLLASNSGIHLILKLWDLIILPHQCQILQAYANASDSVMPDFRRQTLLSLTSTFLVIPEQASCTAIHCYQVSCKSVLHHKKWTAPLPLILSFSCLSCTQRVLLTAQKCFAATPLRLGSALSCKAHS